MKQDKQLIKSVELDLGGKVVKLTMEQAQALKDALDELFGKEIVIQPSNPLPYPVPYPVYPQRPWYWERERPYLQGPMWSSSSGVSGGMNMQSGQLSLRVG